MIEVIFKSKGSKLRAKVPEKWEEITVKQFMALENLTDPLEIMAEIMEVDLTYIQNTTTNLTPAMNRIINIFNNKPPDLESRKAEGFGFQGELVKLPRNIDKMLFGQMIQINGLLEDGVNKNLVKIMGIAIQPVMDGEFIEKKQAHYETLIEQLPIIDLWPELFFFAKRLRKYKKYGMRDSIISELN